MDTPRPISHSVGKYAEGVWSCSLQSRDDVAQSSIVGDGDVPDAHASAQDKQPVATDEAIAKIGCWQLPRCLYGSSVDCHKIERSWGAGGC